ncbi:MAG: dihydrofolate reductase, partial [Clostridia bacterium]
GGNPLPKRVNIVLTRDKNYKKDGAVIVHSPEAALDEAAKYGKEIFVIGGAEIYALFLGECQECLITKVAAHPEADSFFPDLDENPRWEMAEEGEEKEADGLKFRFTVYRRKG